jgi:hypothetical protein
MTPIGRRSRRGLHALYVRAFPPAELPLGRWLIESGLVCPTVADPDPNAPSPMAVALRDGALLYEVDGEPDARKRKRHRSTSR